MKLYDFPLSGNCYKIRLLLAFLGLNYERVTVNSATGETLTPEFKRLNPRGQIPVLEDGGVTLWDSQAILVYLARRYGSEDWLPGDALGEARVMQWLAVAENELLYGLARARAVLKFNRPFDLVQCQDDARVGMEVVNSRLEGHDWLAADRITIADIACYPYLSLADEADLSLTPYPGIEAWMARLHEQPGYVEMNA